MVKCLLTVLLTLSFFSGGLGRIEVGRLPTLAHGVSGVLNIDSPSRLVITEFAYDGRGPDTFVYYFRPGVPARSGSSDGVIVPLPPPLGHSDNGRFTGTRYRGDGVITVDLPEGTTVCDIDVFTIWCRLATQFFTTIQIPSSVFRNGVRGSSSQCFLKDSPLPTLPPDFISYGNCEVLSPSLQLQWNVEGSSALFKLCGCAPINRQNQYMGFGLSAHPNRTDMIGADAVIAWSDIGDGTPNAVDYHLTSRSPCIDGMGVCPDAMIAGRSCRNNVYNVSGGLNSMRQCVIFARNLAASDECDLAVADSDTDQYIVWALGGLGTTAFVHFTRSSSTTPPLNLQRTPVDNCQGTSPTCEGCPAFRGQNMTHNEDTTFRLTIGPAGADRGYSAITSQAGWGIAWYVNGTLVPELRLKRGSTYTFIVEGGDDPSDLANYHPFYITSSELGGKIRNPDSREVVYAGLDSNNNPMNGAVGRLCKSAETEAATRILESCGSLTEYQDALTMNCEAGTPGRLVWTPDENTPDVVYYQCGTHSSLGWKITLMSESAVTTEETSASPLSVVASLYATVLSAALATLSLVPAR